jgi:hypothetical protein
MNRIKFTLPGIGMMELREVEGLVWMEDDLLVIEVKHKLLGILDEETETVKIEPSALNDVYIKTGLFKDRLVLVPKKRDLLEVVPGKHINDVRLRIWRSKRRQTRQLVSDCLSVSGIPS